MLKKTSGQPNWGLRERVDDQRWQQLNQARVNGVETCWKWKGLMRSLVDPGGHVEKMTHLRHAGRETNTGLE